MLNEPENLHNLSTVQFSVTNDEDLNEFTSIDEATQEWLKSLNQIWKNYKKCEAIIQILTDYFESAPNPYFSTLRILVNTSDFKHIKPNSSSLAFTIIEEYTKWIEIRREMYKDFLSVHLKLAAFRLAIKQNNMEFVKAVAVTYELLVDNHEFKDIIMKTVQEKKYKKAAEYAVILQMQNHFPDPESLVLPLILQNKLTVVEDFLAECPKLQKALVSYLDKLISHNDNIYAVLNDIIQKNNIPDVKIPTAQTKPLTKIIARFVKLYNLPPECCPNLNKKRSEGALQFLIYKRYVDHSLSTASWKEMVQEAVGDDTMLQLVLLRMLISKRDASEGLYWARRFNIPREKWPWAIVYEEEQIEYKRVNDGASTSKMNDCDINDDSINYHELKLSKNSIKVVDNPRSFEEFLDDGLKEVNIVGIDSEWKPCFGIKQTELALIQIATKDSVNILDVTTMGNCTMDLWSELGLCLFENKNILKLGFGITQDMTVIRDSLPALSKIKTSGPGYLDIVQLWKKLVEDYKFVFPHESDDRFSKKSLSTLVKLCLGQKLNKSDQFSNWEQRPLRESQITYAALDAYCLLEIYETLKMQCDHLNIPFYDICSELQRITHLSPKKNMKRAPQKHVVINEALSYGGEQNFRKELSSKRLTNFRNPKYQHGHSSNKPTPRINLLKPIQLNKQLCINASEHVRQENYKSKAQATSLQMNKGVNTPIYLWRVVCGSMLGELTSKLRMCGCDCVHLRSDQSEQGAIKLAIHENRVLLTRNKNYLKLAQHLSHEKYHEVLANTPNEQLQEVFECFRVVITPKNIFSRCKYCNCNEFAKVPKLLMNKLIQSYIKLTRQNNHHIPPHLLSELERLNYSSSRNLKPNKFVNDDVQREDRTWILNTNSVHVDDCSTKYRTRIQIDKVPLPVLKNVQFFYICEHCGNIYWNGSNLERTLNHVIKRYIAFS